MHRKNKTALCLGWLLATAFALSAVHAADLESKRVAPPSEALRGRMALKPFYQKCIELHGFPILASAKTSDYALLEAEYLITNMLGGRVDILRALATNKVRFAIMATSEMTTVIPEHSDLTPQTFWDRRARGLGATPHRPAVSCGEENLLCLPGDPYSTENILIHEFGHVVHEMALNVIDPSFDRRLREAFHSATNSGLWKEKYASHNRMEYWAEGVQSWFDTNREDDHDHNHVNTRAELRAYDPSLAKLTEEIFGDKPWRYQRPEARTLSGRAHLQGLDPASQPAFKWPEHLRDVKIQR